MKKVHQVGYFQEFVTRCMVNKIQNFMVYMMHSHSCLCWSHPSCDHFHSLWSELAGLV